MEIKNFKNFAQHRSDVNALFAKEVKNVHLIPKIVKVVLNMGVGEAVSNSKLVDSAVNDMLRISGQKPIKTFSKVDESSFKLRKNVAIGCKVTLRKERMNAFLERLVVFLPMMKDFYGFSENSFDKNANFSFGIKETILFPEIDYDKIDKIRGLDVTIVTSSNDKSLVKLLLQRLMFPFV